MRRPGPWLGLLLIVAPALAGDKVDSRRTEDVVYGRKHGMALTLDVFAPKEKAKANGLGVIFVVSGGWFSNHDAIPVPFFEPFLRRGYTVFAVCHGSQPRFTIPEIIDDLNRAVRFVRYRAGDYGIDPEHLGIFGLSAGGHLSLMQATNGDAGKPYAIEPIGRTSSRVQAVAAFFPPTDFLNYGQAGEVALGRDKLGAYRAPFDFHEFDFAQHVYVRITDPERVREIGRAISPINHVSGDDPPALLIHGDKDPLVPLQQSESILARFKAAGVESKLVVKPGAQHGWLGIEKDMETVADWFDAHLKK
jgi:acetyl esterase/lipase